MIMQKLKNFLKTQAEMLKTLKIPANPLPFSCQKNVQTTSLAYVPFLKTAQTQKIVTSPKFFILIRNFRFTDIVSNTYALIVSVTTTLD